MISMVGAYAIGPVVRTPTIIIWLAVVVAWCGIIFYRWREKLGLVSGALFLLTSGLLGYGAFQHLRIADKPFWSAETAGQRSKCFENMSQVRKALAIYCEANDGALPIESWTDSISEYCDASDFTCPTLAAPFAYTMNSESLGVSIYESNPTFVVAYDGFGGANRTAPGTTGLRWAHGESATVLTMNGGAKLLAKYRLFNFVWDRKTALDPDYVSPFDR
jgi:hypothetical protein